MTVKDTVMNALLEYPTLFLNSLDVYNYLFCMIGNGYVWTNGELVDRLEHTKVLTVKQAIQKVIEREVPRSNIDYIEYYIDLVFDNTDSVILENKDKKEYLKEKIYKEVKLNQNLLKDELSDCMKLIFNVESRYKDFNLYTSDTKRYRSLKTMKYKRFVAKSDNKSFWKWHVYPAMSAEYSNLCNFPEDLKADWAIAIDRMCWFLDKNIKEIILQEYNENGIQEKTIRKCIDKAACKLSELISNHISNNDYWAVLWNARNKEQSYVYNIK